MTDLQDFFTAEEYLDRLKKAKAAIPAAARAADFSPCSRRLQNALGARGIHTVGDLLPLTEWEIWEIPNLGKKTVAELCAFLSCLSEGGDPARFVSPAGGATAAPKKIPVKRAEVRSALSAEETAACEALTRDLAEYVRDTASALLQERSAAILQARLGLDRPSPTLRELGREFDLSPQGISHILSRAIRRLKSVRVGKTPKQIALMERKRELFAQIGEMGGGVLLSHWILSGMDSVPLELYSDLFLCVELAEFKTDLWKTRQKEEVRQKKEEAARQFNQSIESLIIFPRRRQITEADFARLAPVSPATEEMAPPDPEENPRSAAKENERFLALLLQNETFRWVKRDSLRIPCGDGFFTSHFQCLTHDGYLVLIERMSLFHMCQSWGMARIKGLKAYCQRYGFGYLITDGRGHSFEHTNEENPAFFAAILERLQGDKPLPFPEYKAVYDQTEATVGHLLTLIKREDLTFRIRPFSLKR